MKNKEVIICLVFLFLIFSLISYKIYPNYTYFSERWESCLDLLKEGSLYEGQPICEASPLMFLGVYPFKLIFGDNFLSFMKFFVLILNLILFLLIYLILKKEVKFKFLFIFSILYLFVAYIPLVNVPVKGYASLITSVFFMFGVYYLFYSKLKNKEIISGIFLGLAIFSKYIIMPLVALFLLVYLKRLFNLRIENEKIKYDLKISKLWNLVYVLLPVFSIFAILNIIWPNMLIYNYSIYGILYENTYFEAFLITINFLFSFTLEGFFSLSLIIISLISFIKNRNMFSFVGGLSLFIMLFLLNHMTEGLFMYRYLIVYVPFVLIGFIKLKDSIKNLRFKIVFIILLLILIYPGIKMVFLAHEMTQLEREVSGGLSLISEQGGKILTDKDRSQYFSFKVNKSKQDILEDVGYYDSQAGPRLEYLGVSNLTKWKHDAWNKIIEKYFPKLENNEYDLIIIGPDTKDTDVHKLLQLYAVYKGYSHLKELGPSKDMGFFCGAALPNLEHRSPYSKGLIAFIFSNESYCRDPTSGGNLVKYYYNHFDSICKKDEFTANFLIVSNFRSIGINFDKYCLENNNLLFYYRDNNLGKVDLFSILVLILSGVFIYLIYSRKKIKKSLTILIILLLIIFLLLINFSIKDDPYRTDKELSYYSVQKSVPTIKLFNYNGSCSYFVDGNVDLNINFPKLCNSDIDCTDYISENFLEIKDRVSYLGDSILGGREWLENINKLKEKDLNFSSLKCINL